MKGKSKYKSNNNVVYSCKYHIVWCTKYRRRVLDDNVKNRLVEIVKEVAEERRAEIIEMEVMQEWLWAILVSARQI